MDTTPRIEHHTGSARFLPAKDKVDETVRQTKELIERERPVALIGFAGTGNVGELLKQKVLADAKLLVKGTYEKNTDKVGKGVEDIVQADPQAVIMISVNNTSGRFMKDFRDKGAKAQLYNISVVNPDALIGIAGIDNARGTGIAQVVPFPFSRTTRVAGEYLDLLARHAPGKKPSYASFESSSAPRCWWRACAGQAPIRRANG